MIALFGGAAGAGKTTIARLWCQRQPRAVHLELDGVRELIVSGQVDPQTLGDEQALQYEASARACCALARSFSGDGFAVAMDDVFEPVAVREVWVPALAGLDVRIVMLHPSLDTVLARGAARSKQVLDRHVRQQHAAVEGWPPEIRIDSGGLDPTETLAVAVPVLEAARLMDVMDARGHHS